MSEFDNRVVNKYTSIRNRCQEKKIDFDLTLKSISNLLKAKRCQITKKPIRKLSIDRIDPNKGYVQGNVIAVEEELNHKKQNLTPKEVQLIYNMLKRKGVLR